MLQASFSIVDQIMIGQLGSVSVAGVGLAGIFTVLCILFPGQTMRLYTKDIETKRAAAAYLTITAGTFMPMAGATL